MNILNIKKLLTAFFIENWRKDLSYFLVMAGLMFLFSFPFVSKVFMSLSNDWGMPDASVGGFMILASMILASFLFLNLSRTSSSIHELMIPASTGEKLVAKMLLANVYYVLLAFVAFMLGLAIALLIILFRHDSSAVSYATLVGACYKIYLKDVVANLFTMYVIISVSFFGAIYFKKNALVKTIGSLLVIGFIFLILAILVLKLSISSSSEFDNIFMNVDIPDKTFSIIMNVVGSIVIVYNYALSFLRLRETEV